MQSLDTATARIIFRCRQLGVDARVGFVQSFILGTDQPIQYAPNLSGFRSHVNRFPTYRTFAHDLHQSAGVNRNFRDIRACRWQQHIQKP